MESRTPRSGGRPAWSTTEKDRRTVEAMVAYGVPERDIATVIGVSEKTLRKHCRQELDSGAITANSRVAEFLFRQATGKNGSGQPATTAAIFWMKTRAGWKETTINEHVGKDGAPLPGPIIYLPHNGRDGNDQTGSTGQAAKPEPEPEPFPT